MASVKLITQESSLLKKKIKLWGLSLLVDNDILFDTFSNEKHLERRFCQEEIDPSSINHIVISHDHWDHIGGLPYILKNNNHAKIYIAKHSCDDFKKILAKYPNPLIEVLSSEIIKAGIYTSGEIKGFHNGKSIFEHALIIDNSFGEKGVRSKSNYYGSKETVNESLDAGSFSLVVGCSHPGIRTIIEHVQSQYNKGIRINSIVGGLHLSDETPENLINLANYFIDINLQLLQTPDLSRETGIN